MVNLCAAFFAVFALRARGFCSSAISSASASGSPSAIGA
jgi:hypothetical protein